MSDEIWVDFNDVWGDGHTTSLLKWATNPDAVVAGASLIAFDWEGNQCAAWVVSVDDRGLVTLKLSLRTFRPGNGAYRGGRSD